LVSCTKITTSIIQRHAPLSVKASLAVGTLHAVFTISSVEACASGAVADATVTHHIVSVAFVLFTCACGVAEVAIKTLHVIASTIRSVDACAALEITLAAST
jgi:hypothetical protein